MDTRTHICTSTHIHAHTNVCVYSRDYVYGVCFSRDYVYAYVYMCRCIPQISASPRTPFPSQPSWHPSFPPQPSFQQVSVISTSFPFCNRQLKKKKTSKPSFQFSFVLICKYPSKPSKKSVISTAVSGFGAVANRRFVFRTAKTVKTVISLLLGFSWPGRSGKSGGKWKEWMEEGLGGPKGRGRERNDFFVRDALPNSFLLCVVPSPSATSTYNHPCHPYPQSFRAMDTSAWILQNRPGQDPQDHAAHPKTICSVMIFHITSKRSHELIQCPFQACPLAIPDT